MVDEDVSYELWSCLVDPEERRVTATQADLGLGRGGGGGGTEQFPQN